MFEIYFIQAKTVVSVYDANKETVKLSKEEFYEIEQADKDLDTMIIIIMELTKISSLGVNKWTTLKKILRKYESALATIETIMIAKNHIGGFFNCLFERMMQICVLKDKNNFSVINREIKFENFESVFDDSFYEEYHKYISDGEESDDSENEKKELDNGKKKKISESFGSFQMAIPELKYINHTNNKGLQRIWNLYYRVCSCTKLTLKIASNTETSMFLKESLNTLFSQQKIHHFINESLLKLDPIMYYFSLMDGSDNGIMNINDYDRYLHIEISFN